MRQYPMYLLRPGSLRPVLSRQMATSAMRCSVRTRFAPSPTGDLHLGSLRSALYNYLFARSRGGTFVLRIEDTDRKRTVSGAVDRLQTLLGTMGLTPDEGAGVGGPCGPYVQSERVEVYRQHVQQLLDSGQAYRCFCSKQRLEMTKRQALRRGEKPRYDNRCRHLSAEKIQQMINKGVSYVVRFKLEDTDRPFEDLVYGPVLFDVAAQEGDPVILKADGYPTYHLANVVDDRLMGITHVLRGVEWQVSTPKHLALYRAFGWEPPQFAHLPLVTNPDGTKLSKRQGDVSVAHHLSAGYLPAAINHYVCLTGGGVTDLARDQLQLSHLPQLVERFDLSRVNTHSCRLAPERLDQLNLLALRERLADPTSGQQRIRRDLRQLVTDKFSQSDTPLSDHVLSETYLDKVLSWALTQGRAVTLQQLTGRDFTYLWALPRPISPHQIGDVTTAVASLNSVISELYSWSGEDQDLDDVKDRLVERLRCIAAEHQMKFSALMKLLRQALTGVEEGPGVAEMLVVLGQSESLQRLSSSVRALQATRQPSAGTV